ncbi:MAG: hypothetical protein JF588_16680 [Caulobacterales bacterium]|nr:hypothetical protein [Caulobacterales bacterium]
MSEIESLYEWDVDVARLAQMRDRLRRRPEYPAAARRLASALLRDADEDAALGGLLRDAGRTVAGLSAAYLSASGGVTLARLKTFIAGFGLVSPGRARALLSYMRYLGYLELDPASGAARRKSYRLTPQFRASYAQHEASLLEAAAVVEPAAGIVLRNLAAPGVLDALVVEQGDAFVAGSSQASAFDDFYRIFMHRLAGIQILHGLVAKAPGFPPAAPIPFSVSETARRFHVSRIHVSRIIKDAGLHGFVELEPGTLRFTQAGREALDWLYASRLCVHLACAARTLKANPQLVMRVAV